LNRTANEIAGRNKMRSLIALPLLALGLAACQVTKDEANDTITAEFNGDVAENGLADAGNLAGNVAADISNDVQKTADKVENTDVTVDVDTNKAN
jgi:hypothetical protein